MSEIKLDPRNYRKHGDKNKKLINDSLKNLGAGRSIVLGKETGDAKIYMITNKVNGMIYIGFTTQTIEKRFKEHLRDTRAGSDHYIHQAIRKYGKHNFTTECICSCSDKEFTYEILEPHFISLFDSMNPVVGYNMYAGGPGGANPIPEVKQKLVERMQGNEYNLGKKHSESTKSKMSNWQKGRNLSESHRANIKKAKSNISEETRKRMSESGKRRTNSNHYIRVVQLDKYLNLINVFEGLSLAEKSTGVKSQDIGKVCRNNRKTAGGFIWMYEKDYKMKVSA